MRPCLIVVGSIGADDLAQMRFAEHDHMVEAFPTDRADEPLDTYFATVIGVRSVYPECPWHADAARRLFLTENSI